MNRFHIATAAVLAFVAGCSNPKPAAKFASSERPANDATTPPPPARLDTASPTSGSVHVDDKILKACGDIPMAHFAFDSASIQADAAAALDAVARCFATGPLTGRSMRLVGHADPRGETEYNLALGQRRAASVGGYIGQHGVAPSHLATTSRGALDATGTDDQGWARDRRVDILLAD